MPVKRPTIISVIGILNIVFGGLGLASAVCCLGPSVAIGKFAADVPLPQAQGQPKMENPMGAINAIPGYLALQCANVAMSMVTGAILLASGIAFMKMKPWGRLAGFGYAIIAILWAVASLLYQLQVINPAMKEITEKLQGQAGPNNPFLGNPTFMGIMWGFGLLVSFAYPITVVVLMSLPVVKNGLAGKLATGWEPEDDVPELEPGSDDVREQ